LPVRVEWPTVVVQATEGLEPALIVLDYVQPLRDEEGDRRRRYLMKEKRGNARGPVGQSRVGPHPANPKRTLQLGRPSSNAARGTISALADTL
jgi:hypothetical protein